jgi:cytochrome o ubiquinol oxidase subunit 2
MSIPVLSPEGPIGSKERNLIILAVSLSLIVVIPVYLMLVGFAWRYREGNKKAKYSPHFDHSRLIEGIWWAIPLTIITILAIVTWQSSQELDPFKSLSSNNKQMTIKVVALQWKWLFIYPEQNIASVNHLEFPKNTPVDFVITADAPMNSFWIPKLGGQIYAMSGMSTHLHLMADKEGSYRGSSANISGEGFAKMNFTAVSVSDNNFNHWVNGVKNASKALDKPAYDRLAKPGTIIADSYYSVVSPGLYDSILNKFNHPSNYLIGAGT